MTGCFEPNLKLRQAERLFEDQLIGPESIANIGGQYMQPVWSLSIIVFNPFCSCVRSSATLVVSSKWGKGHLLVMSVLSICNVSYLWQSVFVCIFTDSVIPLCQIYIFFPEWTLFVFIFLWQLFSLADILYTGTADGRIVKLDGRKIKVVATLGKPLCGKWKGQTVSSLAVLQHFTMVEVFVNRSEDFKAQFTTDIQHREMICHSLS